MAVGFPPVHDHRRAQARVQDEEAQREEPVATREVQHSRPGRVRASIAGVKAQAALFGEERVGDDRRRLPGLEELLAG